MDWTQSANARRERDELRQTVTPATVSLIRPKAKFGIWSRAFQRGSGLRLLWVGAGFAPGKDGWTGRGYNQLGYIANVDSAKRVGAENSCARTSWAKTFWDPTTMPPCGRHGRTLVVVDQLEPSSKDSLGQGVRKRVETVRNRWFQRVGECGGRTDLFPTTMSMP